MFSSQVVHETTYVVNRVDTLEGAVEVLPRVSSESSRGGWVSLAEGEGREILFLAHVTTRKETTNSDLVSSIGVYGHWELRDEELERWVKRTVFPIIR